MFVFTLPDLEVVIPAHVDDASVMRSLTILFALAATAQAVQAQAAAPAAQAQASQEAAAAAGGGYHVVVIHNSESTSAEALAKVLTEKFNTDREKVLPLIEKIDKEGKAVVIAGSKDSCDAAAKLFDEIGLTTEVRPLDATDMPSEYDNSDVVVGGAKQLTEALSKPDGILVAFHAPWCGGRRRRTHRCSRCRALAQH
jgi:ATP-dependent Clp protease adapter protein ClpS